jgi:hypothetical protein
LVGGTPTLSLGVADAECDRPGTAGGSDFRAAIAQVGAGASPIGPTRGQVDHFRPGPFCDGATPRIGSSRLVVESDRPDPGVGRWRRWPVERPLSALASPTPNVIDLAPREAQIPAPRSRRLEQAHRRSAQPGVRSITFARAPSATEQRRGSGRRGPFSKVIDLTPAWGGGVVGRWNAHSQPWRRRCGM